MKHVITLLLLCLLGVDGAWAGVLYARRPGTEAPLYPLRISHIRTTVTITGFLAVTHVDEEFHNDNALTLEGFYAFQLPDGARVNGLWLWENGQRKKFICLKKEDAQRMYDSVVVGVRRDPAILESLGANRFQLKVFPIAPNSSRRVEIEYFHTLPLTPDGVMHYRYPLNLEGYQSTPVEQTEMQITLRSPEPIDAVATNFGDNPMLCRMVQPDPTRVDISFGLEAQFYGKDFELGFRMRSIFETFPALVWRDTSAQGGDPYFMTGHPLQIDTTNTGGNRDLVFVLDASGSMSGAPLVAVRDAVLSILHQLGGSDRFRLVLFSSNAMAFPADTSMLFASPDNIAQAETFIQRYYSAAGSTNYEAAFTAAFEANFRAGSQPRMLFLTDGYPNSGQTYATLMAIITARDKIGVPIYPVLLYTDQIQMLYDIARDRGGSATIVEQGDDIETVISRIMLQLDIRGVQDARVTYHDAHTYTVLPRSFPKLMPADQLITTGRWDARGDEHATVDYTDAIAGSQSITREVRFVEAMQCTKHVGAYWASKRIDELLEEIRRTGETPELKNSVIELSIRHNVLSPYTAFLVLETNQIDPPTTVVEREGGLARGFTLDAAWPNPVSSATGTVQIPFTLARAQTVRIVITDLLGRVVRVIEDASRPQGSHVVVWDLRDTAGKPVAPGIYHVRMSVGVESATRAVVVVR
jgi:Ca-activated chloride channel homolog